MATLHLSRNPEPDPPSDSGASCDPCLVIADNGDVIRRALGPDIELVSLLGHGGLVPLSAVQLVQVVMNLALNARDAMPRGGALWIETSRVSYAEPTVSDEPIGPGDYVLVSVADNGCGMSVSLKQQIFEPFFTTKSSRQRTGLGLTAVARIVHGAGGRILVYSQPESGSVFKVFLPVVSQASANVTQARAAGTSGTVLLVEDDVDVRTFASEVIAQSGFAVIAAANGSEAIALANSIGFDVLVTDVVMPSMSGPQLVARIRQRWPEARVLYLSGYAEEERANDGSAFLQKPFTGPQLIHEIERLTGLKASRPGSRRSAQA